MDGRTDGGKTLKDICLCPIHAYMEVLKYLYIGYMFLHGVYVRFCIGNERLALAARNSHTYKYRFMYLRIWSSNWFEVYTRCPPTHCSPGHDFLVQELACFITSRAFKCSSYEELHPTFVHSTTSFVFLTMAWCWLSFPHLVMDFICFLLDQIKYKMRGERTKFMYKFFTKFMLIKMSRIVRY